MEMLKHWLHSRSTRWVAAIVCSTVLLQACGGGGVDETLVASSSTESANELDVLTGKELEKAQVAVGVAVIPSPVTPAVVSPAVVSPVVVSTSTVLRGGAPSVATASTSNQLQAGPIGFTNITPSVAASAVRSSRSAPAAVEVQAATASGARCLIHSWIWFPVGTDVQALRADFAAVGNSLAEFLYPEELLTAAYQADWNLGEAYGAAYERLLVSRATVNIASDTSAGMWVRTYDYQSCAASAIPSYNAISAMDTTPRIMDIYAGGVISNPAGNFGVRSNQIHFQAMLASDDQRLSHFRKSVAKHVNNVISAATTAVSIYGGNRLRLYPNRKAALAVGLGVATAFTELGNTLLGKLIAGDPIDMQAIQVEFQGAVSKVVLNVALAYFTDRLAAANIANDDLAALRNAPAPHFRDPVQQRAFNLARELAGNAVDRIRRDIAFGP